MTVALFCGSREWTDPEPIRREVLSLKPGDVVIHGDQRGADLIADTEARRAGLDVVSMAADWDLGPFAGPVRNERMLRTLLTASRRLAQPVIVLAFHGDPLLGAGTRDMIRRAVAERVPARAFLTVSALGTAFEAGEGCAGCGSPIEAHPLISSETDWRGDPYMFLGCDGRFLARAGESRGSRGVVRV